MKKISGKVTWVGKIDWELRHFHGDEYETHEGSSYNSYLIRDEKTALIDTVWKPFDKEWLEKLKEEIDLKQIDYIVSLHGEVDHSGAFKELMREIPDTPIYITANGITSSKGQYHQNWNFVPVKTGDKLSLGETELTFIEARMLHWPDTMFAFMSGENALFSSDGFGQHLASEALYADLADECSLWKEALKYYANILAPFSVMVKNKINEILDMKLPIEKLYTSHGLLWRKNPTEIIGKYLEWAEDYQEDKISIVYDTMWENTRKMADAIAEGIREASPETEVSIISTSKTDKSDVIAEVFRSKAILFGSSTVNNGILYSSAGMLEMLKGLKLKKKKAAAFGSFGWSGEAVKIITEKLKEAGFEIVNDGIRTQWTPDMKTTEELRNFGKSFAEAVK